MKIIQDFKCYALNNNNNNNNNKYIDFEITKYQQTLWKFYDKEVYFIESTLHWNMILFYAFKNHDSNKFSLNLKFLRHNSW